MDTATDFPFALDRTSATPLSVQVAAALRRATIAGDLRDGDRLPSSRALAARLGVSRTVTAAAYEQLHAEGWTTTRHGAGTYVTAVPQLAPTRPSTPAADLEVAPLIDLAPGAPCVDVIDAAAWRRAWRAAAEGPHVVRPQRDGLPAYRAAVSEHLLRHRGLSSAGIVFATAGTSSAAAEIATALFHPGDVVAMEEPGYARSVGALQAAGMTVVPVPVDGKGLRIDAVPATAKAVYCTPAHQYPLGGRMPARRRVELIELARRRDMLIIEDDYDGELRYDAAPLPLLAALGPDVVVHLGTTSKILTPTLGVGWMLAPAPVARAVLALRECTGVRPSPAGQRLLVEFARTGDLSRHLRRLRRELSERRAIVVDTLRAAGQHVVGDAAGSHVVLVLPSPAAESGLVAAARASGVQLDSLARHHIGEPATFGIPIGYTACTRAELERALAVIVECVTDDRRP